MILRLHAAADDTVSTGQSFELWPLTSSFDKCYYEYTWGRYERLGPNCHDADRTACCAHLLVQLPRLLLSVSLLIIQSSVVIISTTMFEIKEVPRSTHEVY
jgi:hypothetical protein